MEFEKCIFYSMIVLTIFPIQLDQKQRQVTILERNNTTLSPDYHCKKGPTPKCRPCVISEVTIEL